MYVWFALDVEPMTAEWTLPSSKGCDRRAILRGEGGRVPVRQGTRMKMDRKLSAAGYAKREPRIAMRAEAVLVEEDGCVLDVVVTDVSREGFRLESESELEV